MTQALDASPRRKRNAEIEIESIHAFSVALRLRRGLASYSEPGLTLFVAFCKKSQNPVEGTDSVRPGFVDLD